MFSEVAPFPQNSNLEFGLRTDVGNDDQSGGLVKSSTLWQSSLMKIIIRVYFHGLSNLHSTLLQPSDNYNNEKISKRMCCSRQILCQRGERERERDLGTKSEYS